MSKINSTMFAIKKCKAATNLANILNEINNEKLNRDIRSRLTLFKTRINELRNLKEFHKFYLELDYNFMKLAIKKCGYPKNVETHVLSIVSGIYKNKLRDNGDLKTKYVYEI